MLISSRNIALGLAVATVALTPAVALAKHGADDGTTRASDDNGSLRHDANDDNGGLRNEAGDDNGGRRDEAGDDNGGRRQGSDDGTKSTRKRVAGSCTGNSSAKLKVKPDDGRLETEFEVDQNRNGVRWTVQLRRNGKLAATVNATTKAPSGSFSVERRLANPAGSDRITARATSPSGEVCKASVTI